MLKNLSFKSGLLSLTTMMMCFALILSATPVHAKTSNAEAAKLKQMFAEYIENQKAMLSDLDGKLVAKGDVTVVEKGSYYAITLPHLAYKSLSGGHVDIGVIAINALRDKSSDKLWKTTVAVPTPIVFYDAANNPAVTISIDKQNFAGVWHETMKNFMNVRSMYKGLKVSSPTGDVVDIDGFKMVSDLKDKNGLWSGPYQYVLKGLRVAEENKEIINIKSIGMTGTVSDFDPVAMANYQEQLTAFSENMDDPNAGVPSAEQALGFYNFFTESFAKLMDGFDGRFAIEGLQIKDIASDSNDIQAVMLQDVSYNIGMHGLKGNSMTFDLGFGYDGLDIMPRQPDIHDSMPTTFNYQMSFENLPIRDLLNLGRSSITGYMQNPEMGQMLGMQALFSVPQLLTQANTTMLVKDTHLGNNNYNVTAQMQMFADMNAIKGAYGKGRIEVAGFDKLLELANKALANPETSEINRKRIQDTVAGLTMMQMFGQMAKNTKGQDIRAYDLELTKTGQMMLNGSDIMTLMGAQ